MSSVNYGVTGPIFTKFSHDIQASFALLMRTFEVVISHSVSECQSDEIGEFAIFSQNRLPWQRPLRYQKRGPDRLSAPKTLSFGEKIPKIGLADPEIIVLEEIIKKERKKLWYVKYIAQSET